jgi:glycosyltransferase involved in cell wall biosynthesis
MTLGETLTSRTNDYGALERRYLEATGGELVSDPFGSIHSGPARITRTASVVIAAWNAQATIRQCLTALELSSFNHRYGTQLEVVVIDDGSSDATWDILKNARLNLNLKLVRQHNAGQYRAINTALGLAEGDIIVSCDDDMILTHFALEELMKRHEVVDRALLLGFRYDVDRDDPRIRPDRITGELASYPPMFDHDNRITFHWPGWPENMCAETGHLKRLNGAQRIFITDGETPYGDYWDLPRMVYGALFSLPRADYLAFGGYDEEFAGWGFGDTLLGARAFALGSYIVPVYSASGLHVAHPDRSSTKWEEARRNLERLGRLHNAPLQLGPLPPEAERRIQECVFLPAGPPRRSITEAAAASLETHLDDDARRGRYLLALGHYADALEAFAQATDSAARVAGQGRAFDSQGRYAEAADCFRSWVDQSPDNDEAHARLALALAAAGRFHEGKALLEEAPRSCTDKGWLRYLMRHPAESHAARARMYMKEAFFRWAARDFEAALLHEPDNTTFRRGREAALAGVATQSGWL